MITKALIESTGIKTFPRPKGIPDDFLVFVGESGIGIKYVHPENIHTSIRVMPGKTHSPNIYQQKPYIVQMKDGKAFDKYGNLVDKKSPEAHIPMDEFVYRSN